ncbi:MBL fold metallo-hydrolase [Haloferula rosea]|uniref:MBL fold metallo-hydrolase n=2 Tax=Haloferula rosea TaxID=490093 RepID=A0A934RDW9_9BACT|nr:MBL fold metallo-hydrolase [Haloferula rosea]
MAAEFEITFLGTGTSVGVPVIGCDCPVCTSEDPRNRRTRSSIHLRYGAQSILVDSGPDLREQALRERLREIDAVIYTHGHVDHVAGFDELRAFCWRRDTPLPMHGNAETLGILKTMFGWAFSPDNVYRGYVKPAAIEIQGHFNYGKLRISPLPVIHGRVETSGFLFEHPGHPPVAYMPDVKEIPAATMALIRNVDILIIDSLRPSPHPTHMSVEEALATIKTCGAGQAWLTHLGHENEHAALEATLPAHVHVAFDGLRLPG